MSKHETGKQKQDSGKREADKTAKPMTDKEAEGVVGGRRDWVTLDDDPTIASAHDQGSGYDRFPGSVTSV